VWARLDSRYVLVAVGATLWMGAIGFVDDFLKIVRGKSQGLVARWKLAGQVTFGLALGLLLLLWPLAPNIQPVASTQVPLFKYWLLPFWPPLYVLFVTVVVTGSSNAVNLTDGLDGLATGLTAIAAGAFAIFAYLFGRFDASRYLGVYFLPGAGELTIFCGALMGAALGFLWFNAHPAQVFMGDTGALAIGGALGTVAILLKAEFLLLIAGGVFAAEAVSVLLQTGAYRWHRRRRGKEYADGGDALAELRGLPGVEVELGRHDLAKIRGAAAVVVSPGVPPGAPPVAAARAARVPVVSEIEIGFAALEGARCIAITGTNGKTTTTALVAHVPEAAGVRATAAATIGRPLADIAVGRDRYDWLAVEVSSFQL